MKAIHRLHVLLTGELASPDLAPAVAWLRANARCDSSADFRNGDPDAIVICLARPGQITRTDVEDLQRAHPLSQPMALVGPWCEGEVRSGKPWPGVTRVYWHQWQLRLPAELARLSPGAFRLPRSATEVDALLSRPGPRRTARPALIGVVSGRHINFEAIALALDAGGHHPVWISIADALPVLQLDALVVDEFDLPQASMWDAARQRLGPLPTVLLANFPRPEELDPPGALPQLSILAKPYHLADLLDRVWSLLESLVETSPGSSAAA